MVVLCIGRNVFVVRAVFAQADELAFVAVELFNDERGMLEIVTLKTHKQVLTNALDGDVFRGVSGFGISKNELATLDCTDFHGASGLAALEFGRLSNGLAVYDGQLHCAHVQRCP